MGDAKLIAILNRKCNKILSKIHFHKEPAREHFLTKENRARITGFKAVRELPGYGILFQEPSLGHP